MQQAVSRAAFRRVKPAHLQIPDPPLQVKSGAVRFRAGNRFLDGEAVVRMFGTGVISVGFWLPLPDGLPMADLPAMVADLMSSPEMDESATKKAKQLIATVGAAAKLPHASF